jgi:solute carrier family 27 fatty acid transporter 1/4
LQYSPYEVDNNVSTVDGATEGNSNIVNIENHVGAVGFTGVCIPEFVHRILLPLYLVRVDKETGEPIRNK